VPPGHPTHSRCYKLRLVCYPATLDHGVAGFFIRGERICTPDARRAGHDTYGRIPGRLRVLDTRLSFYFSTKIHNYCSHSYLNG
jgi:hypothetical protein